MTENELKTLRQAITAMIRKFSMDPHNSPLKKQKDREIAGRFIDKLNSNTFDTGDLPYYSKNGLAKHHNKAECVLAMLCRIVLHYWGAAEDRVGDKTDYPFVIADDLCKLKFIYGKYDSLSVLGDTKGYYLLESMGKGVLNVGVPNGSIEQAKKLLHENCDSCDGSCLKTDEKTGVQEDDVCGECNGSGSGNTEADKVAD